MGKSCSGKSCIALAAAASLKKRRRGARRKRWCGRISGSEAAHPVNPMRPHNSRTRYLRARRRQARRFVAEGQAKARVREAIESINGKENEVLSAPALAGVY